MPRLESPETDTHRIVRARLTDSGVLAWRLGADGRVLEAPTARGVLATWLCNQRLVETLETIAGEAAESESLGRRTLAPGCEVLLLPVRIRRRVSEWTAAMFLTPEILGSDFFAEGCTRVHVDPVAATKAVRPIATFSEPEIARLAELLPSMVQDLELHQRDQIALSGFTATLAEAYEQIELTHRLAGQMRRLDGPGGFLQSAVDGVLSATGFTWAAVYNQNLPGEGGTSRPSLLHSGKEIVDQPGVEKLLTGDVFQTQQDDEALIFSDHAVEQLVGEPDQLVVFPIHRAERVVGALLAGGKEGEDPQVSTYDTRIIDTVGAFVRSYHEIVCLLDEQQQMFLGSLRAITAALDAKDSYTRGHSERVAYLAAELARRAGMSDEQVERVHIAGLLHDVGKIGIAEEVLRKPGKLTDEEFDEIKRHPTVGRDILQGIPQLADIVPGVLWHHERWDGRGYPDRLPGPDTPLIARVLAVADCFDAMSSNRSYRSAMPREKVLAEITRVGGSQLDPDLVGHFVEIDLAEYDAMVARHKPQEQHRQKRAA